MPCFLPCARVQEREQQLEGAQRRLDQRQRELDEAQVTIGQGRGGVIGLTIGRGA